MAKRKRMRPPPRSKKKYGIRTAREVESGFGTVLEQPQKGSYHKRPKKVKSMKQKQKITKSQMEHYQALVQAQVEGRFPTAAEIKRKTEQEARQGRVYRKSQVRRIRKKALGYVTSRAISLRHKADLIEPDVAFKETRTGAHGLQSTAIVSFEYYPDQNMLILVWWKDWKKGIVGAAYAYFQVPVETYEGLLKASSKGRYVYYNVRTSFKYKKL